MSKKVIELAKRYDIRSALIERIRSPALVDEILEEIRKAGFKITPLTQADIERGM